MERGFFRLKLKIKRGIFSIRDPWCLKWKEKEKMVTMNHFFQNCFHGLKLIGNDTKCTTLGTIYSFNSYIVNSRLNGDDLFEKTYSG